MEEEEEEEEVRYYNSLCIYNIDLCHGNLKFLSRPCSETPLTLLYPLN